LQIRPFLEKDVAAVKKFTDEQIGVDYYSVPEHLENQKNSIASTGEITSFILVDETQNDKIVGLRLAFPPHNWAKLSDLSINIFRKLGAKGIITHCWKESPHNSSLRYLEKVGFKKIIEHPLYWIDVDYTCALDGKPCRCTAIEMELSL
jgi:hypothetical protein